MKFKRLRHNKHAPWIRSLNAETSLQVQNLILPVFLIEGRKMKEEIRTLPGVYRVSIDYLVKIVEEAISLDINAIMIFPSIEQNLKDNFAKESCNENNLICRAVKQIKKLFGSSIGIICDVALDPYTLSGHDGILVDNVVDNDLTISILANQALSLVNSGADVVAPSDMMDGRVRIIRELLEKEKFLNANIFSYAVKYASNYYAPFREAIKSNRSQYLSKSTYQLDTRNTQDALKKVEYDLNEGADAIIVKPAMSYLDMVYKVKSKFNVHTIAYQVSGEYAMIKFASLANSIDWSTSILESLTCMKRAGANSIISYAALEVARYLKSK